MSDDFDLRVLSLGAGRQSTAAYVMACRGDIPLQPVDVAIFADTGIEPEWVYRTLASLEQWAQENHGERAIPIHIVSAGNLADDWFQGQKSTVSAENAMPAAIPFHLRNPDGSKGMARRGCTKRYKLTPIQREIRRLLGLKPGARAAGRVKVDVWIGISIDEVQRVKSAPERWQFNRHPLVYERPTTAEECKAYLKGVGFPEPKRSACWLCPYRSNTEWLDLKNNSERWGDAVAFDYRIREEVQYRSSRATLLKPLRGTPYLHASLKPLDEVDFETDDTRQLDLFQLDCEGMCGV